MPVRLSPETLDEIAASGVAVPTYDRQAVTTGIVHFGVGGFHRAHQAMVVDRLLQQGEARSYGICGVGVLEQDRRMATAMAEQGGLYTLVLKHPDGTRESRVVGSIVEYLLAVDDADAVIEKMAHPDTRIVSLTITEGGYNFDHVTGEFVADEPGVAADLRGDASPRTVFGLVVEALRRRRDRGLAPFTVMSCDNIQGNGHVARQMFTSYARLQDPAFAEWMDEHVSFPNSMVDRITPVTTDEDRAWVRDELGIEDAWPVVAEPFFQWVLEDDHPAGRPPYEQADVQLVADVEPYELMKLRLLNASHQGLCYFGYLSGYRYAHEATQDEAIATFLRRYMDEEATPTLHPVPGIDLDDYKATLIERFRNPEVRDTLARLCAESSDRIPKWLLPVVRENLASGGPVTLSAGIVASWARYAEGTDEDGAPIQVVDRLADRLTATAQRQRDDRLAFLEDRQVFGDLVDDARFVAAYRDALDGLIADGAHTTVTRLSRT
ncbi:mannitol dehydrogenase family protein [Curtobacterium caseinilyticum]|uniref:Mannitol-1-phosphate 5-dehydrogenase n=1 Tax=Curtobacterium caseinilyticum TaxID=3055137 RepID=A0ABT7TMZ2_9MICO|nr:mannitol dehydrogenase family protein [Curtobacterium caseinilyticum]MDM7890734.1 mannitol dehydrogenase family protein [Curtobacterium caseinilyticum]